MIPESTIETLLAWLNRNVGVIATIFNLVYTMFLGIFTVLSFRRTAYFREAITAKDALIDLHVAQIAAQEALLAEAIRQKKRAEDNEALGNATIEQLHKRISDLESKQFFKRDEQGFLVIDREHQ